MNPLWQFSLEYYRRPGVETECLSWQERLGADVNVLLMCLWCATRGRQLDCAALGSLESETPVGRWRREVIGPLRAVRRSSRAFTQGGEPERAAETDVEMHGDGLYRSLLEVELKAERIEQEMLWRWVRELPAVACGPERRTLRQLAHVNLRAYAECLAETDWGVTNIDLLLDALEPGA